MTSLALRRTFSAALGAVEALATLRLSRSDVLPRASSTFLYEPSRPGARPPACDVYLPASAPRGWAMIVHGGGFTTGRRNMKPSRVLARRLLATERVVLSIDYPLVRAGITLFDQVASVLAAIDAARARAERIEPGLGRQGLLVGSSAGATLALLAAPKRADVVAGVVSAFGLYDFTALKGPALALFRRTVLGSPSEALARAASPSLTDERLPPVALLHGTADRLVPFDQAEQMAEALGRRGVPRRLFTYPAAPHAFFNDPRSDVAARALEDVADSAAWASGLPRV